MTVGAPGQMMAHAAAPGGGMSSGDVWRIIRAHIWLIIVLLVISAIGGYAINAYLSRYYSRYTATGLIQIQPPNSFSMIMENKPATLDTATLSVDQKTQAAMLKHEALLMKVLKDREEIRQTDWYKSFNSNVVKAKEDLLDNLRVDPIQDTRLVAVSMTYSKPDDCRKIVEEIVSQHLQDQQAASQNRVLERTQLLNNLKQRYQFKLRDLTQDLRDKAIKLSIDGMGTPGRLSTKEVELSDYLKKQFEMSSNAAEAKAAYDTAVAQVDGGTEIPRIQEQIDRDQEIQALKQQLMSIDMAISQQVTSLGAEHRAVQSLKKQKEVTEQKLDNTLSRVRAKETAGYIEMLRGAKESAEVALKGITDQINQSKQDLGDLTYQMSQYLTAKDEEKATHELLEQVSRQLDNMSQVENQKAASGIEWAIRPETPDTPSFPKLPITMAVAIMAGLALSLGIAFLRELMDTSVRSPRDIDRVGELNLLGIVGHEDDDPQVAGAPLPLVIFQAPHSMLSEQYRQLRSRLQHSTSLDSTRSILVTSPSPGDGKTTVATNLAAGLALNGRRILLVDANFRRPELHRVFSVANETGFSTALSSLEAFPAAVCQTQVPNLDVMPSGPRPPNGTELLESQLLTDFIERALEEYDHVIFDSGPLLFVSESMALAPRVDGVVSVVRARSNSRGLLQRMRDSLRQARAEHVGVVLNAVRSQAGGYYNRNIKTYYAYSNYNQ
jgi:capsular exopolysaccharide synthesis family protein